MINMFLASIMARQAVNLVSCNVETVINIVTTHIRCIGRCLSRTVVQLDGIGNDVLIGIIAQHHIARCAGGKWIGPQQIPLIVIDLLVDVNSLRAAIIVNRIRGIRGPVCTGFPPGIHVVSGSCR